MSPKNVIVDRKRRTAIRIWCSASVLPSTIPSRFCIMWRRHSCAITRKVSAHDMPDWSATSCALPASAELSSRSEYPRPDFVSYESSSGIFSSSCRAKLKQVSGAAVLQFQFELADRRSRLARVDPALVERERDIRVAELHGERRARHPRLEQRLQRVAQLRQHPLQRSSPRRGQIRAARRDDGFPFPSIDRTGVAVRGLDRLNAPLADLTDAQGETLFLQRAVAVVEVDRSLAAPASRTA